MRWSELSDGFEVWRLPPARAKNKRELILPLPPLARDVLAAVPRLDGSPFVFTFSGVAPIDNHSKMKRRLDQASGVSGWVLHDIRRSTATYMGEIGVAPHIIERCLNHISGSLRGVAGPTTERSFAGRKAWRSRRGRSVLRHSSKAARRRRTSSRWRAAEDEERECAHVSPETRPASAEPAP
jgi:integrase